MKNIKDDTLQSLGEYNLHSRIIDILNISPGAIGRPGDDACVIPLTKKKGVAICTDIVPSGLTGRYAGKFAVIHNYSDLLAVGARPLGILISLGAPADHPLSDFDKLIAGAHEEAQQYDTTLLGGDTKERSFYFVVGTAIGTVDLDNVLTRDGAKTGDVLAVTRAGNRGWGRRWAYRVCQAVLGENSNITVSLVSFNEKDLILPYREMLALSKSRTVHAAIDCSDGLSASCVLLAQASKVGIRLDFNSLKNLIADETIEAGRHLNVSPLAFCFSPGYDWECLVAIPKQLFPKAEHVVAKSGGSLIRIGEVVDGNDLMVIDGDKKRELPSVGDVKFKRMNQFNSPDAWMEFARSFSKI